MNPLLISSIVLLWIVVLLNLLLTLGAVRHMNSMSSTRIDEHTQGLQKGDQAPDFTAETLDGQEVSLATYAGKSIAFQFLTTHCTPCREEIPDLMELAPLAGQAGVEFVVVMLDEATQARAFVEEFQISLPVLVAPRLSNDFATTYKANATPSYCLIDGQGHVVSTGHPSSGEGLVLANTWRKQKSRAVAAAERR